MPGITKGQLESDISKAITKFEKEQLGRGPEEVRTFIIQDMVLVRLKGVLTLAEKSLVAETDGAELVKQVRRKLIESSRPILENIIEEKTHTKVKTIHTDISTQTGERIIVFVLDTNLDERLQK